MIIALFKTEDLPSLASHRHHDGWEVGLSEGDTCFLRVANTPFHEKVLSVLPCLKRWTLDEKGQLIPIGKSLPELELPPLNWLPLHTLLPAIPASVSENETFFGNLFFFLQADTQIREPTAIRLPFSTFAKWAETASSIRLARLTFAVSENHEVLVLGTPLPPLNGQSLYSDGQLLIPCGFALPPFFLADEIPVSRDQRLLVESDHSVHVIGSELFVQASRAAIRLTSHSIG